MKDLENMEVQLLETLRKTHTNHMAAYAEM